MAQEIFFIADTSNNRIRKVDALTGIISTVAGTGVQGFNGNNLGHHCQAISPIWSCTGWLRQSFLLPISSTIAFAKLDALTGLISTVTGTDAAVFNGDGILATTANLDGPSGVVRGVSGDLFIADTFNNRIRKVDALTGIISTVAGTGTAGFNGDGILATTAQVSNPSGVVLRWIGQSFYCRSGEPTHSQS